MKDVTGVVELTAIELAALIKYTGKTRVIDCDEHDIQSYASARKQLERTLLELMETGNA